MDRFIKIVGSLNLNNKCLYACVLLILQINVSLSQTGQPTPITLTIPSNYQELDAQYPLFTWTSTISSSSRDYYYQIKIVEVYKKQNPQSAIMNNPALYEKDLGTTTIFQYPIDAPELQKCKQYAWQVTAYDKNNKVVDEKSYKVTYANKIGQSEPYVFNTNCNQFLRVTNPSISKPYIVLTKTVDNYVFELEDENLNFKYIEDYAVSELKYKIYNWKRQVLLNDSISQLLLDYGWNYLTVDLTAATISLTAGEIYQLEVETPKGDIYKAKFELKP